MHSGGGLPQDGQATRSEFFVKGTEPSTVSSIYRELKLSKTQGGKLANDEEIEKGEYDVRDFIIFEEADPVSADGKNRWQEAIDAWVASNYQDDDKYRRPSEVSDHKP